MLEHLVIIYIELVNSKTHKFNAYLQGLVPHIRVKVQSYQPNTYEKAKYLAFSLKDLVTQNPRRSKKMSKELKNK